MIGAIAGDIIGSVYERHNLKSENFPLFKKSSTYTDDTVLTVATADAILTGKDYGCVYREYFRSDPMAGYGGSFIKWASSDTMGPYNSWGNGSAMRVSPVGFAYSPIEKVLYEAKKSAQVTHNHPEGIKGAQAVASAVYLCLNRASKGELREYVEGQFNYDLSESVESIRSYYTFDVSCQGSIPQAIICFLESNDFEDAVRKAVSIGGDSDTIACIAGAIAQAYYKEVPDQIVREVRSRINGSFIKILDQFEGQCRIKSDSHNLRQDDS